jgi:WD40 repeat protein
VQTVKRITWYGIILLLMVSCRIVPSSPTIEPSTSVGTATYTSIPTSTTASLAIETPTLEPTATREPTLTTAPPTSTPEPFLPPNLIQIAAANIGELQWIASIPVQEIYSLAFSQSGDQLATISEHWQDRSDYLGVWDMLTGEPILLLEDLGSPWEPNFSPDGKQLFVPDGDRGVEIYDLMEVQLEGSIDIRANWYAFSPDGNSIALSRYLGNPDESTIQLIELATEREIFSFTIPGMVQYVQFSPSGTLLSAGFQSPNHFRQIVWEIASQGRVADLIDYDYRLVFSADNFQAATAKAGKVSIFSTEGWVLRNSVGSSDPYSNPKPRDFSRSGDILAVEDRNHIQFWDPITGVELASLPNECNVQFSPTGTILLTWCYQGDLKILGIFQ